MIIELQHEKYKWLTAIYKNKRMLNIMLKEM